jgi:hypothetical protein
MSLNAKKTECSHIKNTCIVASFVLTSTTDFTIPRKINAAYATNTGWIQQTALSQPTSPEKNRHDQ